MSKVNQGAQVIFIQGKGLKVTLFFQRFFSKAFIGNTNPKVIIRIFRIKGTRFLQIS